uniref:Uncharacterized protein n=2 Tax=Dunaliella tertiolecta TaxID=3047 RepID=A0A7S3R3W9_DUNTE
MSQPSGLQLLEHLPQDANEALQQLSLATTFLGANYIAEHAASILGALQPLLGFKVLGTCVPEGKPGAGSHAGDGTEAGGLSAAATPPTKSRSPPAPQKAAAAAGQAVVVCNR